jgi:hypothetical protein
LLGEAMRNHEMTYQAEKMLGIDSYGTMSNYKGDLKVMDNRPPK